MVGRFKTPLAVAVILSCLLSICVAEGAALTGKRDVLPRVGAIREDEKVGDTKPGCGNHFLYRTRYAGRAVFRSDDDGFNAWMNLDGHNVELELVKTTLSHRDRFEAFARYEYRFGSVRVTVSLVQLTDYTVWIPATIIVRKGRASRTIKAFVTPQCD